MVKISGHGTHVRIETDATDANTFTEEVARAVASQIAASQDRPLLMQIDWQCRLQGLLPRYADHVHHLRGWRPLVDEEQAVQDALDDEARLTDDDARGTT
jgi:hypothetical protein